MMNRIALTLILLAGPVAGASAAAPWGDMRLATEIDDRADDLYDEGRDAIAEGKYDRAIDRFNKLIELKTNRTDAALYWKAYSLAKLGQRADAGPSASTINPSFVVAMPSRVNDPPLGRMSADVHARLIDPAYAHRRLHRRIGRSL